MPGAGAWPFCCWPCCWPACFSGAWNAGSLPLTPCEVWDILVRREGEYAAVIWKLRLPRTLAAALLGGALSVSGFLLQTFFANPIASPFVLGISSGAKLTVSLAMVGLLSRGVVMSSGGMILAASQGPCCPWALCCSCPGGCTRCPCWW